MQFLLNQTFVVQVCVSSKPRFETLTLVLRYLKRKVFQKATPHAVCSKNGLSHASAT